MDGRRDVAIATLRRLRERKMGRVYEPATGIAVDRTLYPQGGPPDQNSRWEMPPMKKMFTLAFAWGLLS